MADPKEKKVKVKILKYVGEYIPGQIIEVSEGYAKQLCRTSEVNDGVSSVPHVRAMLLEDAEKLEKAELADISKMTAADMQRLGIKNIVETPIDADFDKNRADMAAGKDVITGKNKVAKKPAVKGKGKGVEKSPQAPPEPPPVDPVEPLKE